uniref:Dihydroorotate dehydrogenase n=1 Tax=Thermogladius calderae TaxID=1200300 RepID=A0A7J3Y0E3_9CREN
MNASGVLAVDEQGALRLVEAGVSAVVTKSLTLTPREGYAPPIVVPLEYGLLNAVGLANPGVGYLARITRAVKEWSIPVVASIAGGSPGEFARLAEEALEAGVDAVELNLSCPNVRDLGVFNKAVHESVKAVKSISGKPVWAKLSYSLSIEETAGRALDAGADAVVLINTLPAMKIDIYARKPILTNKSGGLSGPAIHPLAVYAVYKVYREYSCDIVGVGGVVDWESAVELIMAGAKGVQIATGFYMKGPGIVGEVVEGLRKFMEAEGYKSIDEIVGLAVS